MPRSYRLFFISAFGFIGIAIALGFLLQPEQPHLAGEQGFQEQSDTYRAGGSGCQPAAISAIPIRLRQNKADSCTEAAEQSRQATNNIIEARRAADAANAQAISAYQQTRIATWGGITGALTLVAAIAAAIFAERAVHQAKRSADISHDAQRPWIAIREAKICRDIDNFGGGTVPTMFIEIEFIVENVGSAPARDFGISYKFVRESDTVSVLDGLIADFKSVIAISDDGRRLEGKVVFPQAKETVPGTFRFEIDPVMKVVDEGGFVIPDPLLVGAFFYRGPHNKSVRYTTFAYIIGYTGGHWPVIPATNPRPPLTKDKLHLMKWRSGWTAA